MTPPRSMIPWYLAAVLGTLAIAVGALVALEIAHVPTDRGFLALLTAIVLPTLTGLLTLLRSAANGSQLAGVRQDAQEAKEAATVAQEEIHTTSALAAEVAKKLRG